jgi:hypothetical protein
VPSRQVADEDGPHRVGERTSYPPDSSHLAPPILRHPVRVTQYKGCPYSTGLRHSRETGGPERDRHGRHPDNVSRVAAV